MDHGGVDAALIHQADGLLGGEFRDLPMRQIARQAAAPDVDLGIDDLHGVLSSHGVPSASEAGPARRLQGPIVVGAWLQALPPSPGQHGAVTCRCCRMWASRASGVRGSVWSIRPSYRRRGMRLNVSAHPHTDVDPGVYSGILSTYCGSSSLLILLAKSCKHWYDASAS